jgi:hypothetical protein
MWCSLADNEGICHAMIIMKYQAEQTGQMSAVISPGPHLLDLLHGESVGLIHVACAIGHGEYGGAQLQQLLSSILSHVATARHQAALALQ